MILHSKPTVWDEKSRMTPSGRGTIIVGPPKEEEKEKEKEYFSEEEFKV